MANKPIPAHTVDKAERLLAEGKSWNDIALACNRCKLALKQRVDKREEDRHNARLTEIWHQPIPEGQPRWT